MMNVSAFMLLCKYHSSLSCSEGLGHSYLNPSPQRKQGRDIGIPYRIPDSQEKFRKPRDIGLKLGQTNQTMYLCAYMYT